MEATKPDPTMPRSYGSVGELKLDLDHQAVTGTTQLSNNAMPPSCIQDIKAERRRIFKNLAVLTIAMLLVFSGNNFLFNLQSTINPESGSTSLAVVYLGKTISSFILAICLRKGTTILRGLIAQSFGFACYVAAQFYPCSYTLLPTALVMGFGSAPLWVAVEAGVKKLAVRYAALMAKDVNVVQSQMLGIFFSSFQFSYFLGSVLTTTVFTRQTKENGTASLSQACGVSYCPERSDNVTSSAAFSSTEGAASWDQIVVVCCVVLLLNMIGFIGVMFFLEPFDSFKSAGQDEAEFSLQSTTEPKCNLPRLLPVTVDLVFLAPMPVWAGFIETYMLSDYAKAYIDCGLGLPMLGPVMLAFGAVATIGSFILGPMVKWLGQSTVIISGLASCALLVALMFVWTAQLPHAALLFVGAGLGGWSNAVGVSQVRVLYGSTFPGHLTEASSTVVLLESLGMFLNYVLQPEVCNLTKIALLTASLFLTMLGFGGLQLWKRHQHPACR